MSETETTVPMDDKALFDAAIADAPAQETPAPEAPEAPAPTEQAQPEGERPRDELGRFVPKAETVEQAAEPAKPAEPVKEAVQPAPASANQEPPPGWIPAWRAREIAESKIRELENKLQELQRPQEPVDPYVDPEKFRDIGVRQAIDPIARQMADQREWMSREINIMRHGEETVQAAYKWLVEATHRGDPKVAPLLQRVTQSVNPFGDIVAAYNAEPERFFEMELERRKKDPAFVAKHFGQSVAPQNGAAPQPQQSIVKLPPSLNRQPGVVANGNAGTMDDQSLYDFATR